MNTMRLIVNPTSGRGRGVTVARKASRLLHDQGITHQVLESQTPDDPIRLAQQAVGDGVSVVVGIGGDGLVSQVANALVGTDTALGIIPAGRGNDFARGLGLPLDVAGACSVIAQGHRQRIDVGWANGRYFCSIAIVGLAAEINRRANRFKRLRVNALYSLLTVATIFTDKPLAFSLTYDSQERRCCSWMIAVGNTWSSARGMALVPAARTDDALLDACIINGMGKWELLLSVFPKVFSGRHLYHTGVDTIRGREITIGSDLPGDVYADGERIGPLPVTLKAIPQALEVLLPEHSQP